MNPDRWAVLRLHIEAATALPEAERIAYLDAEVHDAETRAEVRSLLGYQQDASAILAMGNWSPGTLPLNPEASLQGTLLGSYRLLSELGRGGMGAVYLAERADGAYEHKVAVKVLQESIFTPGLAERFYQERQILARLSHPGIARLLDGGVTPDGRPYLVLEYVDGIAIDLFCTQNALDTRAIIRLFLCVTEVVQSAHQQLVLHLDLKPANILITAAGDPRLLDFGIARVFAESEGGTLQAEETMRLLTPRYASPEQLRGEPLGVASDVFSLGTLLYRLLTGAAPYPVESATPLEAARMISTVAPMLPSKVVPERRRKELEGELDQILLQALRKEPARRYPTVAAFSDDLTRLLEDRPVLAHADSLRYRMGKFFQRNRVSVLAAAFATLLLTIATAVAVIFAIREDRSKKIAEGRLKVVQAIAHSVFDLDNMLEPIAGTLHVRQFALENTKKYVDVLYDEANLSGGKANEDLAHDVVEGYNEISRIQALAGGSSLGDDKSAEASSRKALEIEQRLFAAHPDDLAQRRRVVRQLQKYSVVFDFTGDRVRENELLQQAWTFGQPLLLSGQKTKRYLLMTVIAYSIALTYCGNGDDWNFADPLAAKPWLDRAQQLIDIYRAEVSKNDWDVLARAMEERVRIARGTVSIRSGRIPDAIQLYRDALSLTTVESKDQLEDTARKELQNFLTDLLLIQHDVAGAKVNAAEPRAANVHEQMQFDTQLHRDDADDLVLHGRLHLAEGQIARGRKEATDGMLGLETAALAVPTNAQASSGVASVAIQLGNETALPSEQREKYFLRARGLAEDFARTHPTLLSTAMVIGKSDLGLARLRLATHSNSEATSFAQAAAQQFQTVLAAHPSNPEAAILLQQATALVAQAR